MVSDLDSRVKLSQSSPSKICVRTLTLGNKQMYWTGLLQSVWHSAPQQTLTQTKQRWHHRQSPPVAPKLSDSATHAGSQWRRRATRSTCRFRCPTGQPVPFLSRINDLPKAVKSQVRLFADHCLLYRIADSQQDHQILRSDLNKLERWADIWGMHFNTKKCYILSTHKKSSHYYSLNNHIFQQVDCSPYLRVTLTHDLRWMTHMINNITRKASSTIGFLRRNLRFCPLAAGKQPTSPLSALLQNTVL